MRSSNLPILEICCPTLQSALNAESGGADRIELCSGLEVGGLTPSPAMIRMALSKVNIPIIVLIRPRPGDFCYSAVEFEALKLDIQFCRIIGVAGVACGILTRDGHVDLIRMRELIDEAGEMHFTFHRAFDFVADPFLATQQLIDLGVKSVLTSGQQKDATSGSLLLRELQSHFSDQIQLMAGGGVRDYNVAELLQSTGLSAVHASATANAAITTIPHTRTDIFYDYQETKLDLVRRLRQAIDAPYF